MLMLVDKKNYQQIPRSSELQLCSADPSFLGMTSFNDHSMANPSSETPPS